MPSISGQEDPDEESRRDARIRLILLAVAVLLVAGYAATLSHLHIVASRWAGGVLPSGIPLVPIGAIAAVLVCGAGFLLIHRRGGAKHFEMREAADTLGIIAGRAAFMQNFAGQIEGHARSGRQLALHLVDIDRFRALNEALGEAEGDAFLRRVAEGLLDLVEDPERLARTGDDEFAIIQPETGGARHAEIYARRIHDRLKEACAEVPRHVRPGASIGVAVMPEHGSEPTKLLHSASRALATAKNAGGDSFRVYAREMDMVVEAGLQMEKAVAEGLQHGWFELHFQPQYDLRSRRLTGFEALVRLNHPQLGLLQPNVFLPIAEARGLMQPLGDWIVREALATATNWPPHLRLCINISVGQFRHGNVAGTIVQALSNSGVEGPRLNVEISEAVLREQADAVHDQLRLLKGRGVTIVLDDFGLDSSSLQSLARSPCDAVKLDRSFVQRVGEEPDMETLVKSLIGTAQSFDLAILAEGVERAEQAHFLVSNACRNVQGYLFGRPAPMRDVAAIIAKDLRKAVAEAEPEPTTSSTAA
jgi:diguanylate cyclase (GGDEF)-like protein